MKVCRYERYCVCVCVLYIHVNEAANCIKMIKLVEKSSEK